MSTNPRSFTDKLTNFGLGFWALILIIALAVFGANFLRASYLNNQENNARGLTADLQVLSQQLAKYTQEAVDGNADAFVEFKATKARIDSIINALRLGDDGLGVPGFEGDRNALGVSSALAKVTETWTPMATAADRISASEEEVLNLADTAAQFTARVPRLSFQLDEVVRALSDADAPASQISIANRQIVLADRMSRRVTEIVAGGENTVSAADALSRDATVFAQVLEGLRDGNEELGVNRITSPAGIAALQAVQALYDEAQADLDIVLNASADLAEVQGAATQISEESNVLLENSQALFASFDAINYQRVFPNNYFAIGGGIGAVVGLLGLLFTIFRDQRRRLGTTQELNQRNQEAILRLLDEMGSLAEGDLTVKATVTEDITGAIADSINFAVEALRSLVSTINETAVQVAAAAQETQATAMHLAEAAEHQAQQITSASAQINEIASSIDEVSKNSAESADVAQRSVQIAAKGAEVVRQTIQGMDNIRDQIQETSKRIKRLGESSQEIGSIVELINDISEQTNILALNAAIQAASAGEAGRGFAVVADEVQRLAERASNATKRIEALVQTIQSDTNEAVSSMEQTTAEVVAGARLAEDAGLALGEIEKVSNDLADLIQNISQAARQQSTAATNITATMSVIQEITSQTSHGANQTAESIGNLAQLAADLRRSVADFKLPG
ncbi:MAG: type IV pili methyl-accepting chemotaxis transducer N-terminal domain-containing protein [Arenimonas sp.]|nr:type IV pili methyl-accepting chemotaxis transducer N-terminal domain-containing protein [Arenimonas sp.]MBP6626163.1 type IV pili methyl-accepting chemotaxis transducer N-terminal domain-containing protein [Arenimonas sp.]